MLGKTALSILLILCLARGSHAGPVSYTWHLAEVVRSGEGTIELRDDKGRILKRVNTDQLLYIYSAAQAIKEAAELNAEVFIVDGEEPNAFATKGKAQLIPEGSEPPQDEQAALRGKPVQTEESKDKENLVDVNMMGINFAMLDMLGMDVHMMAALIGHELAHLKLNHGEEAEHKDPRTAMHTAANTKYSRDNEREADYLGTVWSVEAGYDPQGAVRLQELLYKNSKFKGGAFVGSHPSSTERIAILKSLARRLGKDGSQ
ncbi:MAG: M48 family metalloprotease [Gammaproteobacteria bacterium]|nr:M48 family metalloprotease [Gammaproteobacteria bacterium]